MILLKKYLEVYEKRWSASNNTADDDILVFDSPKTQVEFFYLEYNEIISEQIRNAFTDTAGRTCLELGCGRGTSSIFQSKKLSLAPTASDYSSAALKIARKNFKKYMVDGNLVEADIYKLPFDDNAFDVVISLGVFEHLEEPDRAFSEIFRVLSNDGIMVHMIVPEHHSIQAYFGLLNRFLSSMGKLFKGGESKPWLDKKTISKTADVHRSNWYGKDFSTVAQRSGFKELVYFGANPFPTINPVPNYLEALIVSAYQLILKFRKKMFKRGNPFCCSEKFSRCHFLVARKR